MPVFKDNVAWITGASSGIGEGLARQLAKQGAKLILSGRRTEELERVNQDCGGGHLLLPFETTDYSALPGITKKAEAWHGRIDMLINNAGISQRSVALETQFSVYQRIVDVDLLAPIALTQLVLPGMAARKSGRIAMISSIAGKVGSPMRTGYCAAKHGLIGYADALRVETAGLSIKVHVIAPGSIRTNVSRNAVVADGSARGLSDPAIENGMDPQHAADLMLRAMARDEREIIIAKGFERKIEQMRRLSRNRLFDTLAALFEQGYADKMKSGVEQ